MKVYHIIIIQGNLITIQIGETSESPRGMQLCGYTLELELYGSKKCAYIHLVTPPKRAQCSDRDIHSTRRIVKVPARLSISRLRSLQAQSASLRDSFRSPRVVT